jgi:VCBS repeat-containing protein/parallel beta-helix repeat protein
MLGLRTLLDSWTDEVARIVYRVRSAAPRPAPRELRLTELEERLLFSVTPLMIPVDAAALSAETPQTALVLPVEGVAPDPHTADAPLSTVETASEQETSLTSQTARRELVFIDAGVYQGEKFLNDLQQQQHSDRELTVIWLEADQNGIEQITSVLGSLTDQKLDAVHFISHGTAQAVKLGSLWLDVEQLEQHRVLIEQWSHALKSDADLLFYGCDLAGSALGRQLLTNLASATGADVAASVDATGAAPLGGNWELEFQLGLIESDIVISDRLQAEFPSLLAAFNVVNTNDSGAGSLRQAILDANALGGSHTISFAGLGAGTHVIHLQSSLVITSQLHIAGTTAIDYAGLPRIILDGTASELSSTFTGIFVADGGAGTIIEGLVIRDFGGHGISISEQAHDVTVRRSFVGNLNESGAYSDAALGNRASGIFVAGDRAVISDNILSGNTHYGITVTGSAGTVIRGNRIGTNLAGTLAIGNGHGGIGVFGGAVQTEIGGPWGGHRNLISGNSFDGILIDGANETRIRNNFIGTNSSGLTAIANGQEGIQVSNASGTIIGEAGLGNVISGNSFAGINLFLNVHDSLIQGNRIGVGANGTVLLGNGFQGIDIGGNSSNNLVGGTTAGAGNLIAGNSAEGVVISGSHTLRNSLLGNVLYANGSLGIDLRPAGEPWPFVTANDLNDADTGPNDLQNFPEINSAVLDGNQLQINGILQSTAHTTFRIEFFSNPAALADSSGYGEGRHSLGHVLVTTNTVGNASFTSTLTTNSVAAGDRVTATATVVLDPGQIGMSDLAAYGSTSEFAANIAVTLANTPPQIISNGGGATATIQVPENTTYVTTVIAVDAQSAHQTLTYSISGGPDAARFTINSSTGVLTFLTAPNFESPNDVGTNNVYDVIVQVSDGAGGLATQSLAVTVTDIPEGLWFTTTGNVTSSGVPGLPSWGSGQILQFSDPNLRFEGVNGTTAGTITSVFNVASFASGVNVDGIEYVTTNITIGSGANSLTLQPGDVLLSLDGSATLTSQNSLAVTRDEVFLFRPAVAGNYSSGTFHMVLDNFGTLHGGGDTWSIALVEQTVQVGDYTLQAGTFLFSRIGASDHSDIRIFIPTGVGNGTTSGTVLKLVEGSDPGVKIDEKIVGLEIVTRTTTIGGITLNPGTILLSVDKAESIGSNNVAGDPEDIFGLVFTQTTLGSGSAVATAFRLVDGSDVNLDTSAEAIDGLALYVAPPNQPPVITSHSGSSVANVNVAEGSTTVTTITVSDPDGAAPVFSISGGLDQARFTINPVTGVLSFRSAPDFEQPTDSNFDNVYEVKVDVHDGRGGTASQSFNVIVTNVNEAPTLRNNGIPDLHAVEGTTFELPLSAGFRDPEGGLTYAVSGLPAGLTLNASTGLISGSILAGTAAAGPYSISVTATDPGGLSVSDTFTLTVHTVPNLVHTGNWTATTTGAVATAGNVQVQVDFAIGYGGAFEPAVNDTLNNIPAFSNTELSGAPSLGVVYRWDTTPEVSTALAADDAVSGLMTITFSTEVTNPILHLDRLGGYGNWTWNSMQLTLLTPDATLEQLSGTASLLVDAGTGTIWRKVNDLADTDASTVGESSVNWNKGTAAGSIQILGTFTSLTFLLAPAPGAVEGAGGDGFELAISLNHTPIAVGNEYVNTENSPLSGNLLTDNTGAGVDHDPDGDSLQVIRVNGLTALVGSEFLLGSGAALQVLADGSFVYLPGTVFDHLHVGDTATDSFTYTVSDPNGGVSTATVTIIISGENDAPSLLTSTGSVEYVENAPAVILDAGLLLADVDSTLLTGASVRISAGYAAGQDQLLFSNQSGITGSWNNLTGTLTLTGTATLADYQTALRSVSYLNSSEAPADHPRTIEFIVHDQHDSSLPATRQLLVTPVNDVPIAEAVSVSGLEDAAFISVTLSGSDVDGTIVAFRLSTLPSDGMVYLDAGLTTLAQSGVDYLASSGTLQLYFVPAADWFGSTGFTYRAIDDLGASSQPATVSITVTPVNDAPVISFGTGTVTYNENAPPLVIDSAITVTDVDSADFAGGVLTVTLTINATAEDRLRMTAGGLITLNSASSEIFHQGTLVATWTGGDQTPLQITFNSQASAAVVQAVARRIGFEILSEDPSTLPRTVVFALSDGDGGTSPAISKEIRVVSINDPPVTYSASASGLEDAAFIPITLTGTDVDGTVTQFRVVSLPTNGTLFADAGLTTAAVAGSNYTATGEARTFYFVPDADWHGSTSFTFRAIDAGGMPGNTATGTVEVTPVNDPPMITVNQLVISEGAAVVLGPGELQVADVDTPAGQLQLTVTHVVHGYFERLSAPGTAISSFTVSEINAGEIRFVHDGGELAPGYEITVSDGEWSHGPLAATVAFTNVNDAPVLLVNQLTISEGATVLLTTAQLSASDVDHSPAELWFQITGLSGGRFERTSAPGTGITSLTLQDIQGGLIQFVHDGGEAAPSYFVTLTDGEFLIGPQAATVIFTHVNDPPLVAIPGLITVHEDTAALIPISISDSDHAGGQLEVALSVGQGTLSLAALQGITLLQGTGTSDQQVIFRGTMDDLNAALQGLSYLPAEDYHGTDTLTVVVNDLGNSGAGGSQITHSSVPIFVWPVNDPPVQTQVSSTTISEGEAVTLAAGSWFDADGDNLTFAWDIDGDGVFGGIGEPVGSSPLLSWAQLESLGITDQGTYSLAVQANDGAGGVTIGQFLLTVLNAPPVAVHDQGPGFSTDEVSAFTTGNVLVNDTDPASGDALSVSSFDTTHTLGLVTYNGDGTFQYHPNGQFDWLTAGSVAHDSFTYTITDGDGGFSTATVTITITGMDNAPEILAPGHQIVDEDTLLGPLPVLLSDVDTDLAQLQLTAVSSDQSLIPDSLIVIGGSGGIRNIQLLPAPNAHGGPVTITLAVSDNSSVTYASFTVTVNPVNDPPVLNDASFLLNENSATGTLVGLVPVLDPDSGDSWTYEILSGNIGAAFSINNAGELRVANPMALDYEVLQQWQLVVQVTDSFGETASATATINLLDLNDTVPVIPAGQQFSIPENLANGTVIGSVTAVDPDTVGTFQNWELVSGNDAGIFAIDPATGVISIADNTLLDFEQSTQHLLQVRVNDGLNTSPAATVLILVQDVNEFAVSPILDTNPADNSLPENTPAGTPVGITAFASDPDGTDSVTYALLDDAGGRFTIEPFTGVVTTTQPLDYETATSHSITVEARSTDGSTTQRAFTILVQDVNEFAVSPILDTNPADNSLPENAPAGTPVGITAFASDPDGTDSVTYALLDDAGGRFTIEPFTGVVTTTQPLDYETATSHSITVEARSTDGSTTQRGFTILVQDVNEGPTAILLGPLTVLENAAAGTLLGLAQTVDVDAPEQFTYQLIDDADGRFAITASGELLVLDGTRLDFEAATEHMIRVRSTDRGGLSIDKQFVVQVLDVNEAPQLQPLVIMVAEHTAVETAVARLVAMDPDAGDFLTFRIVSGNTGGIFRVDPLTGDILIQDRTQLVWETTPQVTLEVEVSDLAGLTDLQSVFIEVVNVNSPPEVPSSILLSVDQGQTLLMTAPGLTQMVVDPDSTQWIFELLMPTQQGSLSWNSDGTFFYTPYANNLSGDRLSFRIFDGWEYSEVVGLEIRIRMAAPAPVPTDSEDQDSNTDDSQRPSGQPKRNTTVVSGIDPALLAKLALNDLEGGRSRLRFPGEVNVDQEHEVQANAQWTAQLAPTTVLRGLHGKGRSFTPVEARSLAVADLPFAALSIPGGLLHQLDVFERGLLNSMAEGQLLRQLAVGGVVLSGGSLTVGYAFWLLRSGTLFTAMLSVLPSWVCFDPLPILDRFENEKPDDDQDEDLARIAGGGNQSGTR